VWALRFRVQGLGGGRFGVDGLYLYGEVHEVAQLLVLGLSFSRPSTTKVDSRPGNTPKV